MTSPVRSHKARSRLYLSISAALALLLPCQIVLAQVVGTVTDPSGELLFEGVRLEIRETGTEAVTDREGRFRIDGLPTGNYTLVTRYLGFESREISFDYTADTLENVNIRLELSGAATMDRIWVRGIRSAESRALNRQRAADNLKNVVAADFVGKFPDKNIAEVAKRIPGVGIQRDQGEGRFINLRGAPIEFSNVSVNGLVLPSPNPGTRALDLDTIPSDIIQFLEVSKTLTPDQDADAIAGNINIVTQGAFDVGRQFLRSTIAGGQNRLGRGDREEASVTWGNVFGPEDRIGILLSGSFQSTDRVTHNIEHVFSRQTDDDILLLEETEIKDYELTRERMNFSARLDYKLSDADRVWLSFSRSRFEDEEFRNATAIDWEGNHRAGATQAGGIADGVRITKELRDRTVTNTITNVSTGASLQFNTLQADFLAAYSEAKQELPIRTQFAFRSDRLTLAYDFADPDFPIFTQLDGNDQPIRQDLRLDEDRFSFRSWDPRFEGSETEEITLKGDFELPLSVAFADQSTLKFGAQARLKEKFNNETRLRNRDGRNSPQFADITGDRDSNNFGRFNSGRIIRLDAIRRFADQFDDEFLALRIEQSITADFDVDEDTYAGYVMNTIRSGPINIVAGVRVEHTRVSSTANAFDADTEGFSQRNDGQNYTRVFPGINFNYELSENSIVRAAWTTGLSRPNFDLLVPFAITSDDDREVARGNPDLDPTYSHNLDLIYEYYLQPAGLISAGAFYKRLKDPIFSAVSIVSDGGPFDGFEQERPENGSNGELYGFELAWQQQLVFLPGFLSDFGVFSNYTWTRSSADLPFDAGSSRLEGTSRHTANAAVYYERGGFNARLSYNYRSKFLNSFNVNDPELNNFWDARGVLDLTVSYQLTDSLEIFGEGSNLTDTRQRRFDGSRDRVNELEEFGESFLIGLRLSL